MKTAHFLAVAAIFFGSLRIAAGDPSFVYLVRHAEKVDESKDADLSPEGFRRAEMIAKFFEQIPIDTVVATQFQRTQKTVSSVAQAKRLTLTVIDAGKPTELIALIRSRPGATLLVSGHSNTIPELIQKLGGPELSIPHEEYSDLFLLVLVEGRAYLQRFQIDP